MEMMNMTDDMAGVMHDDHVHDMSNMNDDAGAFCTTNMGMIMYMDGFRFGLAGGQTCLNLYFPSWTLNTRGKFIAAMFGVFLLGISVEGVSKLRQVFVRRARRRNRQVSTRWNPHLVRAGVTGLHGFQALMGYILMLATMTYSAEFLMAVVSGLAVGYATFFQTEENYLSSVTHVTTNPCCNFMEEEAKEVPRTSFLSNDSQEDGEGHTVITHADAQNTTV